MSNLQILQSFHHEELGTYDVVLRDSFNSQILIQKGNDGEWTIPGSHVGCCIGFDDAQDEFSESFDAEELAK